MPTFHFNNYELGTRCNLRLALEAKGFTRSLYRHTADFGEENLCLDDAALLHLERKDLLWTLLGESQASYMPRSILFEEHNKSSCLNTLTIWKEKEPDAVWIVKPALLNNGTRIVLFDNVEDLNTFFHSKAYLRGPYVIQQYLTDPHLYAGCKYAYRLFVILTHDACVYLYPSGYANISKVPYEKGAWDQRKMHITNFMLDGILTDILQLETESIPEFSEHYPQIQRMTTEVMRQFLNQFPNRLQQSKLAFELLGFDFICDAQGKVWLLEVNHGPDCPRPVDDHPLYFSFWTPFWNSIVDEFITPIVHQKQTVHAKWQPLLLNY